MPLQKVHPEYIDGSAASSGQALVFDGTNVVWSNVSVNTAGFVTNTDLTSNLTNYVTNTNFVSNLVNYQTVTGLAPNVQTLTANNANNLGGVAAALYLTSNGTYTITGVHDHTANIAVRGVIANGSIGLAGQALLSDGTSTYWGTAGVNTDAQYTWANQQTFSNTVLINAISANGTLGTAGQVLTSNGSDTYWSTVSLPVANSGLLANATGWHVVGNTGIIANSTGVFVDNNVYPNTAQLTSNVSTAYTNAVTVATNLAGNAYTNAVSVANTNATNLAGNAYSNAVAYVVAQSYVNTAQLSSNVATAYTNAVADAALLAGNAYSNAVSVANTNATNLAGNAYSNAVSYVVAQSFVNTAQLDANVSTAYTNAVTVATNLAGNAYSNAVSYTDNKIANLVNSSPAALDTLNELAMALGNDANFATTVTNGIASAYTNAVAAIAVSTSNNANYFGGLSATGGTAGQVLTSAGAGAPVWSTVSLPVANSGLLANATGWHVVGNTGIIANSTGVFVDSSIYPNTTQLTDNVATAYTNAVTAATNLAGNAYSNAVTYVDGKFYANTTQLTDNVATAYTNAVTAATNLAGNAYTNAVAYVDGKSYVNTVQLTANLAGYAKLTGDTFTGNVTLAGVIANGSIGTAGQVLASDGSSVYWTSDAGGTVTSVATGNGMVGGPVTSTGTVSVLANTGIIANSTGVFVDGAIYPNTTQLTDNVATAYTNAVSAATNLAGNAYSNAVTYVDGKSYVNTAQLDANVATAYTNAVTVATNLAGNAYTNAVTVATDLAGNAYTNAVLYVDGKSYVNTTQLTANVTTAYTNAVTAATDLAGNAYTNAVAYVVAQSYVNTTQLTANLAAYQTTAGLPANVATLASNSSTYVLANTGIISNSTGVFVDSAYISAFTVNNALNLGGVSANAYVKTVNGIVPDSVGNVPVTLTEVITGSLGTRPGTSNNGVVYVVSGDSNTLNDGKSFISDGTAWFEISGFDTAAADARYINVSGDNMSGTLGIAGISANGSLGTAGQVLTSDGVSTYWSTDAGGTVTSVATGAGLKGGPFTTAGTVEVLANTGIIANSTGVFVDSSIYPNTVQLDANVATAYTNAVAYIVAQSYANTTQVTSNASAAYTNAVADATNLAGNAYSNAVAYVDGKSYVNTNQLTANLAGYAKLTGDVFTGNVTLKGVIANGSIGTAGEVLATDGSSVYWTSAGGTGTVTSVITGDGMTGGPVTSTGTVSVLANAGIIANSTGVFVDNSVYPNTVQLDANVSAAYTNAVTAATDLAGNAYSNAVTYVDGKSYVNTTQLTANLTNYAKLTGDTFTGNVTLAGVIANGSIGTAGQVLATDGTITYWSTDAGGTVTSVATGNGLSGGPVTSTGTIEVLANTGIIANSTGVFVDNSIYPNTTQLDANVAAAYTNAVTVATDLAGNAYTNAVAYVDGKSYVNTTQLTSNLTNYAKLSGDVFTGNVTLAGVIANGSIGTAGQILATDGTATYWTAAGGTGTVTSVITGNGLSGGPVTSTGTIEVVGNTGIIANSTGVFVDNSIYPNTVQLDANVATAYTNAIAAVPTLTSNNANYFGGLSATGGTAGQVLTSAGAGAPVWSTPTTGTVTSVITGDGLSGGPVTTTGTVSILANAGIIANSTGVFVNGNTGIIANGTGVFVDNNIYPNTTQLNANLAGYAKLSGDTFTGNVTLAGVIANGSIGTSGQVLTTDGTIAYWSTVAGVDADATYSWTNTHSFSNTVTLNAISANGTLGTAGQVLTSNGSDTYWSTVTNGTVTSVITGNGLSGGPITGSGTIDVVANAGIVANSTGIFVNGNTGIIANSTGVFVDNSIYPNTVQLDANVAAAYSNSVTYTDNKIANLVNSSPAALDTLNELAMALGNDANFSTTVLNKVSDAYTNAVAMIAVSTSNNSNYYGGLSATGGTTGQVLTSAGTGTPVWSTPTTGTVTSVATGNGLKGGTVTSTGTIEVLANTGIIANSTGVFVDDSIYATTAQVTANAATAYANAVADVPSLTANNANFFGGLSATTGTSGQVLTSAGAGTPTWTTISLPVANNGLVANSTGWFVQANTGVIANSTGVFVDNTVFAALSGAVFTGNVTLKGVLSNGSIGTAGQVLTSNGSETYWSTISGVNTAATYAWTNTHSFSNTVTLGAISANGGVGTAGQVLTSNGSATYWAAASGGGTVPGANTQIYFNDSGVANAVSAYTFNKSTNNVYVANSIGINVATPLAKIDVSGTAVHNIVNMGTGTAMDLSLGQVFTKTTTSSFTFSFSNVPASRVMTVVLHLTDGGSFLVNFPSSVKWPSGSYPTLTISGTDVIVFHTHDGGTTWRANIFGKDIK